MRVSFCILYCPKCIVYKCIRYCLYVVDQVLNYFVFIANYVIIILFSGDLPPVTIKGSRDHLHVYYHLPKNLSDELPEKFRSESGIHIIPILFNKGA